MNPTILSEQKGPSPLLYFEVYWTKASKKKQKVYEDGVLILKVFVNACCCCLVRC